MENYVYEGENYCWKCLPVSEDHPEVIDASQDETDSPTNCSFCNRPLDYSLTKTGVQYVLGKLQETLDEGPQEWNIIHDCYKDSYYDGCRHAEITRDWAKDLLNYSLSKKDEKFVQRFLELTN